MDVQRHCQGPQSCQVAGVSDSKARGVICLPVLVLRMKNEGLPGGGGGEKGGKGKNEGRKWGSEGRRETLSQQPPDQDPGQKRGERETERSRLKETLMLSIAPNQDGAPIQGVRVPSLEKCKVWPVSGRGFCSWRDPRPLICPKAYDRRAEGTPT